MNIYIARRGDSLDSIAHRHGISAAELAESNSVSEFSRPVPGMALLIPETKRRKRSAELFGFVSPDIAPGILQDSMPFFSFISPYACGISPCGTISTLSDADILAAAAEHSAMSVISIANMDDKGIFCPDTAHALLNDAAVQGVFFENLRALLAVRKYRAVNIELEYVYSFDREAYGEFILTLSALLHRCGCFLFVSLPPLGRSGDSSCLYCEPELAALENCIDRVILLPKALSSGCTLLDDTERRILRMSGKFPSKKLLLGIDSAASIFSGAEDRAEEISSRTALELAVSAGAEIKYDCASACAYFEFTGSDGSDRLCRFHDVRSMRAYTALIRRQNLAGLAISTLNYPFPAGLNAFFSDCNTEKFL